MWLSIFKYFEIIQKKDIQEAVTTYCIFICAWYTGCHVKCFTFYSISVTSLAGILFINNKSVFALTHISCVNWHFPQMGTHTTYPLGSLGCTFSDVNGCSKNPKIIISELKLDVNNGTHSILNIFKTTSNFCISFFCSHFVG